MFIDTHAHLYLSGFDADREAVVQRAVDQNVKNVLLPNIDNSTIEAMLEMERKFPGICLPMMGLHPCSVKENYQQHLDGVEHWLTKRRFVAVGEIGTDLYWDKTFKDEQILCFETQIALAKAHDLPVVIHSRETLDQNIDIVRRRQDGTLRGVFHCFTGDRAQARKIEDLGFFMGIGGIVTFKNAGIDRVVADLPLESLLLETDAPYLTPEPHRGKRNESAYLKYIAAKIGELHNTSVEEVGRITSANAERLFGNLSDPV